MKIILVTVISLDGKTTKGNTVNSNQWASKEDQMHFESAKSANNLIVMGRATYEAAREIIKLEKGKLRVVLTRNPEKFKKLTVPGQLEFSKETPKALVKRLEKQGYKQMLLVAGANVNGLFFKANLVDEVWLTVEPKIFGSGNNLLEGVSVDVQLALQSIKKLNQSGTLLLKYKITP
jgi:dihydrofolate reductase